jgi:hypothetical protein
MLDQEQAFFEAHAQEYIRHFLGQWVVIHGAEFLGAYSTEQQAYEAALQQAGNEPVLIRLVTGEPRPVHAIPAMLSGSPGGRL